MCCGEAAIRHRWLIAFITGFAALRLFLRGGFLPTSGAVGYCYFVGFSD
jgi:hypothetical protein